MAVFRRLVFAALCAGLLSGVFAAVAWGSDRVLAQTRANLVRAGLRVRLLPVVWDVDRPEDLDRLRARPLALAAPRHARR